ncbi:unnamed protein product [Rangifer tarandus platyrhynchus]|uniref:Uncharacterized protein n=1 Tax=Rangifer tarandus platyrhynchus TaxID=3082113 RepID=A0ABN8YBB1_RANTA|nr:unnamed protein product [Rangifer tarandus platyrhynchus]
MILKQPESCFCGSCSPKPMPTGALVACLEAPSRGLLLATRLGRGAWDLLGPMDWKAHAQSALVQTRPHVVRRPGCAAPHLGLSSFSSKACWRSCLAPSHLPASISSRCRKAALVWVFMYDLHRASILEQGPGRTIPGASGRTIPGASARPWGGASGAVDPLALGHVCVPVAALTLS